MVELLIQGLLIGIVFSVPVGAIGALTLQRTLQYGFKAGFITGLGSTAADMIYALAGILGITLIQDYVQQWRLPISILGGSFVILIGISVFRKKVELEGKTVSSGKFPVMFFSSFVIAICNPATILSFLAVFTMLNIEAGMHVCDSSGLIIGIALGSCIWWFALSFIGDKIRKNMAGPIYQRLYWIMGVLLCLFGIVVIISGC